MWTEQNQALCRTFRFADFAAAWAFMQRVAVEAERLNHHPWWANSYNVVEFRLSTHDADDTITAQDYELAQAIDQLAMSNEQ